DWGLADFIGKSEVFNDEDDSEDNDYKDLTRPGKVPGTLNYIAPERVRGEPTQATTDIYSLGVLLYQLITLRIPFQRTTVKAFRKTMHLEKITDPRETAPYRDIPQHLSDIAMRCLRFDPQDRFQSVDEMIVELKSFLEGKPEWIPTADLHVENKLDWEFQENVLLAKHTAITRSPEVMEWVSLMISRASFSGNTKLETRLRLRKECQGVGILLSIPEAFERNGLNEGYCVWIGKECRLFQNNVEVIAASHQMLETEKWHDICLEKIDNHLFLYIDQVMVFHSISHIPMTGTHVGLLARDADFSIEPLKVSVGSQNVMVNCLAVPDAFLAAKNYTKALLEYRRIASSFAGRTEGREALFRAGITLLQEAGTRKKKTEKEQLHQLALEEFSKLRYTPGAPLEYLGKSLVYKATKEIEEEIKCLELCLRKYPKHPLLRPIREHIAFRMHEASSRDRIAAYHFALLALRHLPQIFKSKDHARLLESLKENLEPVPFMLSAAPEEEHLACQLAFWLAKPITLVEMIENSSSQEVIANALYALLAMGRVEWAEENLHFLKENVEPVRTALLYFQKSPVAAFEALSQKISSPLKASDRQCAAFLFERALLDGKIEDALPYFHHFPQIPHFDALQISAFLQQNGWKKAEALLEIYPQVTLADEYSPLFAPMGCFLAHTEGQEIALSHFCGSIDLPHPPTSMLLSYHLRGKKDWVDHALPWEKVSLFRQLAIYYNCIKKKENVKEFSRRLKKELNKLAHE
ncbi:MAG: protein kinase, partial [Candidatus Melainabacteria bacterium]|nr:protein kinase [Candidatus Melainabacteria bacterium]